MKTHALKKEILHGVTRVTRAAWSPDGRRLAVASTDARVRLWDVRADRIEREIIVDRDVVWSVAFSPDARRLATASGDEIVTLWDVETGARIASLTGHSGGATDVTFLGDGASLAAVDRTGRLHFWDVLTGRRLIEPWQAHQDTSWRIVVHPDGVRFATAGDDGYVRLWDDLSVGRACEISRDAFDENRRKEYFGEAGAPVVCASR
jgi:WD40 repeat protein